MKRTLEKLLLQTYRIASGFIVEFALNPVEYNGVIIDANCGALRTRDKARFSPYFPYNDHSIREKVLIDRHLPKDVSVVELGGGIGYISAYINQIIDNGVAQIVVEPNPKNVACNKTTRHLNGCTYKLLEGAYDADGVDTELSFNAKFSRGSTAQRMSEETITVSGYNLATIVSDYDLQGFVLLSDMEGGEFSMIDRELQLLVNRVSMAFIEFHEFDDFKKDEYVERLLNAGFTQIDEIGGTFAFRNEKLASGNASFGDL